MREKVTSQILWNEAGRSGLMLGIVCCIYSLIVNGMSVVVTGNGILITAFNFVLWIVKFLTCIGLMRAFIGRFALSYRADSPTCVKFGRRTGLLSALIFAAYTLAEYKFIFPADYAEQWDTIMGMYSSILDSNTISAMEGVRNSMPIIAACTKFVYCYLWGWMLALIFGMGTTNKESGEGGEEDNDDRYIQ